MGMADLVKSSRTCMVPPRPPDMGTLLIAKSVFQASWELRRRSS
jgi:hypothetical protein